LASSTINDMFTHFEQLGYLDFYTLIKLSVILHFVMLFVFHVMTSSTFFLNLKPIFFIDFGSTYFLFRFQSYKIFNSNHISDGNFLIILSRCTNLCCYRNLTSGRSARVGFLNSTTISKIENKFREHGVVKNPKTEPPATLNEDAQLAARN
jgi:hypothetical protein